MFSKRELEGYLEIDHRESPGITLELAAKIGRGTIPVAAGKKFQAATMHCPYCERMIIRNPSRERARNFDPKTDRYMCDDCALVRQMGGELISMKQKIQELQEATDKGKVLIVAPPTRLLR